ncbi:hypothetical protein [Desulfovibrio sp. UCD-KL4C]|uniref:hypothetical protein n=1 Tax=Desulfovibrio sp. UCD-KL4C TaxID=2578120 RepID=UPI0025C41B15|nr:hypothetical protein [Desulfovibrio sp. UCD-KL4C]
MYRQDHNPPYAQTGIRFQQTKFIEEKPLWISAPWVIEALCSRSVAKYGQPTHFCDRSSIRLDQLPLKDGPSSSPLEIMLNTERIADFKQAGIIALAGTSGKDHAFVTGAVTMDGGPLKFKMFLSQLTGFLILVPQVRQIRRTADLDVGASPTPPKGEP